MPPKDEDGDENGDNNSDDNRHDNEDEDEDSANDESIQDNDDADEVGGNANTQDVSLSVANLIDFMIARAQCNPQAFIFLLDMRFAELIFSLRRAESRAKPSLYIAVLRCVMLLCVCTNATRYVERMCNITIDLACMSDAERAIYDKFILF